MGGRGGEGEGEREGEGGGEEVTIQAAGAASAWGDWTSVFTSAAAAGGLSTRVLEYCCKKAKRPTGPGGDPPSLAWGPPYPHRGFTSYRAP